MPNMQTVFLSVGKLYGKLVAIFKQLLCFLTRRSANERDIDDAPAASYSALTNHGRPTDKIAECRYSNPPSLCTHNSWSQGRSVQFVENISIQILNLN